MPIGFLSSNKEFWMEMTGFLLCIFHAMYIAVLWIPTDDQYEVIVKGYSTWTINISTILGGVMFIHWIRALLILNISKDLSPFLIIFGKMLYDIIRFLALTTLTILMFACSFSLVFKELDNFSSFDLTLTTLFQAMMGEMYFEDFDDYS